MKLAIMQPTFNPWLGYFDLIDYVDKFIFLDTVQLNQRSWQTRNKIKVQDKELIISIPIQKNKLRNELLIKDTLIDFRKFDFRKKLIRTLEHAYKKSKYYDEINEFINKLIFYETEYLNKYNINIIKKICKKINIDTEMIILSETNYNTNSKKGEQILDIFNYFHGDKYISPLGSKEYLEKIVKKLSIEYQYYSPSCYNQVNLPFMPYMGIFDLLYNEGFENSLKIIKRDRVYKCKQY